MVLVMSGLPRILWICECNDLTGRKAGLMAFQPQRDLPVGLYGVWFRGLRAQ